jgi:hypothetical protein
MVFPEYGGIRTLYIYIYCKLSKLMSVSSVSNVSSVSRVSRVGMT